MTWGDREIRNAVIVRTSLGFEDHGIFTFYINLDYGGSGQGFGGYGMCDPVFDEPGHKFRCRRGTAFGAEAIMRLLKVVGVEKWEDLKGKSVRADCEHTKVHRLGHYLKDEWVDLSALADEMRAAKEGRDGEV
jgi:hypothetical protein